MRIVFQRQMTDERRQFAVAGGELSSPTPAKILTRSLLCQRFSCNAVLAFADCHRKSLLLITLCFYLIGFNGQWRIQSDAAFYLSIGRNLAEGKGFTYLGLPDHLAYPGWPTLIAGTFKIFGTKSLFAVNVLMLVIALTTLAAIYRLFLLYAGRPTAVIVCVGVGLTKAFYCYGFELWSDMPFALGVMSTLAGYEGLFCRDRHTRDSPAIKRAWNDYAFFFGGISIAAVMRPTIWPLLVALGVAIIFELIRRQKKFGLLPVAVCTVTLMAIAAVAMIWMHRASSQGRHGFGSVYIEFVMNRLSGKTGDTVSHTFSENYQDLFTWAASDVLFQTRLGPVCNTLLSLLVLGLGVGLFRYRLLWGLWFCLLLTTILLSQQTLDRYFLPVLPLLVYAWWDLLVRINRGLQLPYGNLAFIAMALFGGLMNLTKVSGIIAQQHEKPFLAFYDHGIHDVTPRFSELVHERVGDRAIVLAKKPYGRVTAFLSDRCVTNAANTSVDMLQNRPVFVVEPSDLATQNLLRSAGLAEGPALFTVVPEKYLGPQAIALSLHTTHRK